MQNVNDMTPHYWVPSWQHMGDCAVCGHMRESTIHFDYALEKPKTLLEMVEQSSNQPVK